MPRVLFKNKEGKLIIRGSKRWMKERKEHPNRRLFPNKAIDQIVIDHQYHLKRRHGR